ncbi:MAG: hypothetical protein ACREA0_06210 [bacterium]
MSETYTTVILGDDEQIRVREMPGLPGHVLVMFGAQLMITGEIGALTWALDSAVTQLTAASTDPPPSTISTVDDDLSRRRR